MGIKGLFKNSLSSNQLMIFFAVFFLSNIIVAAPFSMITRQDAAFFRMMLFCSHLGTFVFSALFLSYLFSDNVRTYLKMRTGISEKLAIYIVLSMLTVLPFQNLTIQINEAMKFPEWMKPLENQMIALEENARQLTDTILTVDNWMDLIANLLIIGALAAIGEELLFRGVLQNVFGKSLKNKHLVIWLAATLFSAFHLQFYGFIPRILMGAYFGYLLYYTQNIWAPILAHFTNNAFAVLASYKYQKVLTIETLNTIGTTDRRWWLALISLILWGFLFYRIIRLCKKSVRLQNLPLDNHQ